MSENLTLSDLAVRPSYGQIREGVDDSAKSAWDSVDREKANLRAIYQRLEEQTEYTEEFRAAEAWEAYESTKERVEAGNARVREALQKAVRSGERFSIPLPPGEPATASDTSKILAQQNEAARIIRQVERQQDGIAKESPFKQDKHEILREEYSRGLETGGAHGGIICRGVLEAAAELGVDVDSVVDPYRKDKHHASLARAQRNALALDVIGGYVPEPPFKQPGRGRGSEPPKRQTTVLVDRNPEPIITGTRQSGGGWSQPGRKRRRPWK